MPGSRLHEAILPFAFLAATLIVLLFARSEALYFDILFVLYLVGLSLVAIRRVLEHKKSAVQAEKQLHQLAAIVESTDEAILTMDLAGDIIDCNPASLRRYGYSRSEFVGQPIEIVCTPESALLIRDLL